MSTFRYQTFNLNLLRVFDTLYDERSVTRAAARLNLTQSAVSHALAHLRDMLGDDLFVRSGMGMVPTSRAEELAEQVQKTLRELRLAITPSEFDPLTSDRTFTIGAGDYGNHLLLPELSRRLRAQAPHTRLRMVPLSAQVVGWLDEGEVDIALSMFVSVPERMSSEVMIADEEWVWVVRRDHPLDGVKPTAQQIYDIGVVAVSLSSAFAAATNDGLVTHYNLFQTSIAEQFARGAMPAPSQRGAEADRVVLVPNYYAAMHLVSQSDMATLLPRRLLIESCERFMLMSLQGNEGLPRRSMTALWHNDYGERPAVKWLRKLLREVVDDLPVRS